MDGTESVAALPPGFVLEPTADPAQTPAASRAALPPGFVLETPTAAEAQTPTPTRAALPSGFVLEGSQSPILIDASTGKAVPNPNYQAPATSGTPPKAGTPLPLFDNPDLNTAANNLVGGVADVAIKQPANAIAALKHMATGEAIPAAGSAGNVGGDAMQQAAAINRELQDVDGPALPGVKGLVEQTIPRTVGQVAGLATLGGSGTPLATGMMAAEMGGGAAADKYIQAKQAGATDAQALEAAGGSGAFNAGAGLVFGPVSKVARGLAGGPLEEAIAAGAQPTVAQSAKFVGLNAAGQSGTMAASQLGTNAADQQIYDPTRPLTEGVGEAALMGLGFGALHAPEIVSSALRGENATVPETTATLQAQQADLVNGKRDAMLFTPGTQELPVPDGFSRLKTSAGVFHYNPDVIEPAEIKSAVQDKTIGDILDYGISDKPDLTQPHTAVVRRDAQGNEIESVVTDQANLPQVLAKQGERAEPGQSVATENPQDVIAGRQAGQDGLTPEEFTAQQQQLARQKRLEYYAQKNGTMMTPEREQQIAQDAAKAQQQAKLQNAQAALDRAMQLKQQQEADAHAKQETLQSAPDDVIADMAHKGDPDALNELSARNDGNELEINLALQEAKNREAERMQAAEQQARYEQESQEFAGENPAQGAELLDAVKKAGGLPYSEGGGMTGDLAALREGAPKGLFNPRQTDGLDRVRQNVNAHGFDFQTPDDLVKAVTNRLRTGKAKYGEIKNATEAEGQGQGLRFSRSGSASEPENLDAAIEARLTKKLADEKTARQAAVDARTAQIVAGEHSGGDQGIQRGVSENVRRRSSSAVRPEQWRDGARAAGAINPDGTHDSRALYQYAKNSGHLIPIPEQRELQALPNGGQSEHDVYQVTLPDGRKVIVKSTLPGKYGLNHTLDDYLQRMERTNKATPSVDWKVLGVTPDVDTGFPRLVTEMNQVEGVHPDRDDLHQDLEKQGFERTGLPEQHRYVHKATGLEISDARDVNFIQRGEGENRKQIPIDIDIHGDPTKPVFAARSDARKKLETRPWWEIQEEAYAKRKAVEATNATQDTQNKIREAYPGLKEEQGGLSSVSIRKLQERTGLPLTDLHTALLRMAAKGEVDLHPTTVVPDELPREDVAAALPIPGRNEPAMAVTVRASKSNEAKPGAVTPDDIAKIAKADDKALPDLWSDRAKVMTREEAAQYLDKAGTPEDAAAMRRGEMKGFYDPSQRRVILVPENMHNVEDAKAVMREEANHDLLDHPQMRQALREFFNEHMTDADVKALVDRGYGQQRGESDAAWRERMADEFIAQNGKRNTTLWQKFVAYVQQTVKRLFGKELTPQEIASNYLDRAAALREVAPKEEAESSSAGDPAYAAKGGKYRNDDETRDRINDRISQIDEALARKTEEIQRMREAGALKADIATRKRYIEDLKMEKADLIAERDDRDPATRTNDMAGEEPPETPSATHDGNPSEPPTPPDVGSIHPWGLTKLFLGTKDIFNRTKGLEFLGKAIEQHVDRARKYQGELTKPFLDWGKEYNRAEKKQAYQEFEKYWGEKDAKQPQAEQFYGNASKAGRDLIDLWRTQAKKMGMKNIVNQVMVHDQTLNGGKGGYRPVGMVSDFFPRTLRQDVIDALSAPNKFPEKAAEIVWQLREAGFARTKEEALKLLNTQFATETTNDKFNSIEKARLMKLPTSLYDYSFDAARRYMMRWAERTAQIEAYGQKVGPHGHDLFDTALDLLREMQQTGRMDKTRADATGNYINAVRDRAYGKTYRGAAFDAMRNLNAIATGTHLANPATILMNVQSGLGYNFTYFGSMASMKGLAEVHLLGKLFDNIDDAVEKGLVHDDLMHMVQDTESAGGPKNGGAAQKFATGALKYSGYTASEYYIRATTLATAKAFLRQALRTWDTNPTGRSGLQYQAWFQRNGFDVRAIKLENGNGPATDAFLRGAVNNVQGGYRFDQVPVWMDTPLGRFLFKYQKWGSQMARNAYLNVFEPAIKGTSLRYMDGDQMKTKTVRQFTPVIQFAITAGLIGWGTDRIKEWLFGRPDPTASFAEIGNTLDHNFARGLELIADKYISEVINAGALGTFGNYAQTLRDFTTRSRFQNPLNPPALAVLEPSGELAMRMLEQGKLTGADMDNWLQNELTMYRTLKQSGARALGAVDPYFEKTSMELRRQDLSWLGNITRRYAGEVGLDTGNRLQFQRVGKTPDSPYKDAIREALLTGDRQGAQQEINTYLATKSPEARGAALEMLQASIRASQPLKVGSSSSEATKELFLKWAQQRLDPADVQRIQDIDQTYTRTATSLGLMQPAEPASLTSAKDQAILHLLMGH